jgi:hypothetical protein
MFHTYFKHFCNLAASHLDLNSRAEVRISTTAYYPFILGLIRPRARSVVAQIAHPKARPIPPAASTGRANKAFPLGPCDYSQSLLILGPTYLRDVVEL